MRTQLEITYNNDTFDIIVTHLLQVPPDPTTWASDWDYYGWEEIDWEFVHTGLDYLYSDSQKDEIKKLIREEIRDEEFNG